MLDRIVKINEGQLAATRKKIKETMAARTGLSHPPIILVESDEAYNNPIKGRSFYQPGTQVCQPEARRRKYATNKQNRTKGTETLCMCAKEFIRQNRVSFWDPTNSWIHGRGHRYRHGFEK